MEQNEASNEDLDSLEAQLRASLVEVQRKKAERARLEVEKLAAEAAEKERIRREEEARRPLTITVTDFTGGLVILECEYRDDLLMFWRAIPGRIYRGHRQNGIPIKEWITHVEQDLKNQFNVEIAYAEGVREAIDFELNTPIWFIEIANKRLKLTPGPRHNAYDIQKVPGLEWQGYQDSRKKYFTAPLSEGWRVFQCLEKVEGVLWSDEAKEFVVKQVEMRSMLDKVGMATDWEYDPQFVRDHRLRSFQRVACGFVEATGGRALLAYEMGLGKTPMSIAYAWKNHYKTLVICPASLKVNWCRQIMKFTDARATVLTGAEPTKYDLIQLLTEKPAFTVINYDILGRVIEHKKQTKDAEGYIHEEHQRRFLWVEALNMAKFDLIIFDESHYIKNTDSNRSQAARLLKAERVLHMTGTPVLNRPGELWPMLTMLAPDVFPSEEIFIKQYTWDGKRARNVEQLHEMLKSIMIRRRHADVQQDMPPLNRIEEYHELSEKAKKLYKRVLQGVYEKVAEFSSKGQGGGTQAITNILVQIQRLKQICAIDKVQHTADLAIEIQDSHEEGQPHGKVLIFSQFKASAFAIAQRLGHEALCFVSRGEKDFVTADNQKRDDLVQQFQNDPTIKYLVVTEKTAKEGHDITEAGYVIFNDLFWTPAGHEQGEGRAYMRVSDPHGITSYYLITDANSGGYEIEEWIWDLLKMKQSVINQTVEQMESARTDESIAMQLIQRIKDAMWSK